MLKNYRILSILMSVLIFSSLLIVSCSSDEDVENKEVTSDTLKEITEESGEESGKMYTVNDTIDAVMHGVKLVLSFDADSSSFVGTLENVSEEDLMNVRVEVHLSNGTELGPTKAVSLTPGQTNSFVLDAKDQEFEKWNAHAEVGDGEHDHEHDHEAEGDHDHDHEH